MTLKMFALQALVSYGALTLSAFVYLPFGQDIMDVIVQRGFFAQGIAEAQKRGELVFNKAGSIDFKVDPSRMHNQLFAVLTTSQVIGAFTETALPFLLRKVAEYRESRQNKTEPAEKQSLQPSSADSKFLTRVREEMELPAYDSFADYAEMAAQFGYIALWSVLWPLAPVMGFVNNFFELRSDAFKITLNNRRPFPVRVESIGPWLEVFVSATDSPPWP
jgi:anoctamin-10